MRYLRLNFEKFVFRVILCPNILFWSFYVLNDTKIYLAPTMGNWILLKKIKKFLFSLLSFLRTRIVYRYLVLVLDNIFRPILIAYLLYRLTNARSITNKIGTEHTSLIFPKVKIINLPGFNHQSFYKLKLSIRCLKAYEPTFWKWVMSRSEATMHSHRGEG